MFPDGSTTFTDIAFTSRSLSQNSLDLLRPICANRLFSIVSLEYFTPTMPAETAAPKDAGLFPELPIAIFLLCSSVSFLPLKSLDKCFLNSSDRFRPLLSGQHLLSVLFKKSWRVATLIRRRTLCSQLRASSIDSKTFRIWMMSGSPNLNRKSFTYFELVK